MTKKASFPVIDTHAHLDELPHPQEGVNEARAAGVVAIVAVGQDVASNRKTMEIAGQNPGFVFPALGYHPWRLNPDDDEKTLEQIDANLDMCIALGEVGLDYKAKTKKKVQKAVFLDLLAIAKAHQKPIILHCRFSHARAFEMVKEAGLKKAVFHWYSGPLELIVPIAESGYYMSACPALLYNPYHQEAIKAVPLSNLLLETDAPVQYGDLVSRPAHVQVTLQEAARVKGISAKKIAEETTKNARRCFGFA
jgi:TatD DNase family protein